MLTLIVLKELILSLMLRFWNGICAMFLEMPWASSGSVIRNVVLWSLRGVRGTFGA